MSGEIDGHCPTLHHFFIVSLNVFTTLFLLHLHFASLDMAICGAVCDIHFLKLMHFIWSAKPSQLTSCHSGVSYDITPLVLTVPSRHHHRSTALSNCNVQPSPDVTLLYFARCYLPQLFYQSFTSQYFSSRMALFWFYFPQRLPQRRSVEK